MLSFTEFREKMLRESGPIDSSDLDTGALHRYLKVPEDQELTDEQIQQAVQSDNPHVRKMGIFAQNARKWNHSTDSEVNPIQESGPIDTSGLRKGALHRWLGVPEDKELTSAELEKAANSKDADVRKMANFAKNAKKWNHK